MKIFSFVLGAILLFLAVVFLVGIYVCRDLKRIEEEELDLIKLNQE